MNTYDMARALGRRGGRARAQRLDAARRKHIASLGGLARAMSLRIARSIEVNFQYAAAVAELRVASRTVSRTVTRRARFAGRLPGIYPAKG